MRGLTGMITFFVLAGWFSLQSAAVIDRLQDRVRGAEADIHAREVAAGLTPMPVIGRGEARTDWRALFGTDETLPSGVKQRDVWKRQTGRFLAGEPITRAEARRARGTDLSDPEVRHAAAERRQEELLAQR